MADDSLFWTAKLPAPRQPNPGELLFEFIRSSSGAMWRCELRFHGETYGWEVQFIERGELVFGHGAFVTRQLAVAWAEHERKAIARE